MNYAAAVAKKKESTGKGKKVDPQDTIGIAIRAEVERQGMSVYTVMQMAGELGVSRGTVYGFLKQGRAINTSNASAIMVVLGMTVQRDTSR